jgi:alpha/beta superfamily hydrolase
MVAHPMETVRFTTEDGLALEGAIRRGEPSPRGSAVLCHPHPKHGGSKDHPVLWAIRNDLAARRALTALVFNFRGVMGSEGSYGGGDLELADVGAAVDRVREEAEGPTALVGWSFGAWVALRHALTDRRIAVLALVAFPFTSRATDTLRPLPELGQLEALDIPILLAAGDADPFCPIPEMRNLAGWLPRGETLVVEGTDHHFGRRERELAEAIGAFVDRALGPQ